MKRQYRMLAAAIVAILAAVVIGYVWHSPRNVRRLRADADSLKQTSSMVLQKDSFSLAYHCLREALSIYHKIGDKANEMNVRSNMAVVYYGIGLYDEADKELTVVSRNEELLDYASQLMYYRCKGIIETILKREYDNAIRNMEKVIALERDSSHFAGMIQDMANLSEIYIYSGDIEKAHAEIRKIDVIADSLKMQHSSQYFLCKGRILFAKQQLDDAYQAFEQCSDYNTLWFQPHLKLEALGFMCKIDSIRQDKDKFIVNIKRHIALNDSLNGSQITSRIARLQEQQKIEIELTNLDKRNKLTFAYLLSGFLAASLLALVLFLMYRQSKSRQRLLQLETDKLDGEIMMQRMQNELLELKVSKNKQELQEVRQENLAMSLHLASINEKKTADSLQTFDNLYMQLNEKFGEQLRQRHPNLTTTEQRFLCLIKVGMTSHEMMSVLSISQSGIYKMRYRLKKKLGLSADETIENYLSALSQSN